MSVGELSPSAVALAEMGSSRPRADSGLGLRLDRQASVRMVWKDRAMPGSERSGSGAIYLNQLNSGNSIFTAESAEGRREENKFRYFLFSMSLCALCGEILPF
jgi:hypothetical protein